MHIPRRQFLSTVTAAAAMAAACRDIVDPLDTAPSRLRLRPGRPRRLPYIGDDVLYGEALRRAYIRVPASYDPDRPAPLAIALHGNLVRGDWWFNAYGDALAAAGIVMLAPDSASVTWDAITDDFGPDVAFINDVASQLFDRCAIDPDRIWLVGFSDGASYALSLGLANGDQVRRVVAHSPGFIPEGPRIGRPPVFISHGTEDLSLGIDYTSRIIVPALRNEGYDVAYTEFEGGHLIPGAVIDSAIAWLRG